MPQISRGDRAYECITKAAEFYKAGLQERLTWSQMAMKKFSDDFTMVIGEANDLLCAHILSGKRIDTAAAFESDFGPGDVYYTSVISSEGTVYFKFKLSDDPRDPHADISGFKMVMVSAHRSNRS